MGVLESPSGILAISPSYRSHPSYLPNLDICATWIIPAAANILHMDPRAAIPYRRAFLLHGHKPLVSAAMTCCGYTEGLVDRFLKICNNPNAFNQAINGFASHMIGGGTYIDGSFFGRY